VAEVFSAANFTARQAVWADVGKALPGRSTRQMLPPVSAA
jgi:hypothetical protein